MDDASPTRPTRVILSADDRIVPVPPIRAALGSWGALTRGVRVATLPGLGHGAWLASDEACERIARAVAKLGR
eukprot:6686071-Prymnesium_polylepis.2